jgi:hypothetical protein
MDDFTFTLVSGAAAVGGALGSFVGFRKLLRDREVTKLKVLDESERLNPLEHSHHVSKKTEENVTDVMAHVNDFTRTIGYIGFHSLYGMVVYPWMPLYVLGSMVKRDMKRTSF